MCTVRLVATGDEFGAVASFSLQELAVGVGPGDIVVVEDSRPLPLVTFRYWRATATRVDDRSVVIDPPMSGAQRNPSMRLPGAFALKVEVGDTVLCTRQVVADIEVDGQPSDPERLLVAYERIRDAVLGPESALRIPVEEPVIDEPLVTQLIAEQFPQWSSLAMEQVSSWENAMFRLGDELAVRLTRGRWALGQLEKEHRWLPLLAPYLPLPIPVPLALGRPGAGYPWRWLVTTWVDGADATSERIADQAQAGRDLAAFLLALQSVDATGGPSHGQPPHWFAWRPFPQRATPLRQRLAEASPTAETAVLTAAFDGALDAGEHQGPPVWVHGDIAPDNVVASQGRIAGVIDFGVMSVGDPAYDYAGAWRLLTVEGRHAFREALGADDATWARARGWAVLTAASEVIADEVETAHPPPSPQGAPR